ncbi:MAG TPA: formate dehydrogenase accessory sulfurtransferase FdhD [Methanotrichaceae archaeon]|nr:formate dehydrogenase accessory sulfurtransferase FdhD [Methanotrichaceae archaeon]
MFKEFSCLKSDELGLKKMMQQVVEEVPLSIFINGRHYTTALVSPALEKEFVLGHLFSERIISGLADVESFELEKRVARVIVSNPMRAIASRRPIVSGCGGTASYLDESKLPEVTSDLRVSAEEIHSAIKAISVSELHEATGGVHSVGLFNKGSAVAIVEDIGRHNALDKVIGAGLQDDIDFSECYTASTGRISSDMALKCSGAKIPIIASRGATTSLALMIAERTGLTIIGFARGRRMNIYTRCDRIAGSPGPEKEG